jgi:hypothetical protein
MGLEIPYSQIIYYNSDLKCGECCGNGKFKIPYLLMIIASASMWCPSFGFTMTTNILSGFTWLYGNHHFWFQRDTPWDEGGAMHIHATVVADMIWTETVSSLTT